jgi:flagellar assembly factor FliW
MQDGWIEMTHARAGEVRVREDAVIEFQGLPGFPDARRFALVHEEKDDVFQWLVCLDDAELAFVVTDPLLFFPEYHPTLPAPQLRALGAGGREEVVLLAIGNLGGETPRLNLAAPLIVHLETRRAAQIVLDDPRFSIAQPLPAPTYRGPGPDHQAGGPDPEGEVADRRAGENAEAQIESKPQT